MKNKMRLAHILVAQKFEAEDLLRKLREGSAFPELARKNSTCPSAKVGGDLGLIALERLDQAFSEAAEALSINELSPIVRTRFGYHLIMRLPEET